MLNDLSEDLDIIVLPVLLMLSLQEH